MRQECTGHFQNSPRRREVASLSLVQYNHLPSSLCPTLMAASRAGGAAAVAQSLGCVQLPATPWTAARQASLSFTSFQNLLKLVSTESMMPSNHLILYHPLLLLPSVFPSSRVFSNESCYRLLIKTPSDFNSNPMLLIPLRSYTM